jgi:hypothetical protein
LRSKLTLSKPDEIHASLGPSSVGHKANPKEPQHQHRPG